eukprot:TRINITY_DN2615_c0_g1_i1.p1 TRINITY_DN2615_c0_g1~~TRINITY_DN2615_c0_g1_i1.p1  ORF type:complete len:893 (+),score=294.62 TRINITY_DN2615_c0_g1_i1:232-2910(+)
MSQDSSENAAENVSSPRWKAIRRPSVANSSLSELESRNEILKMDNHITLRVLFESKDPIPLSFEREFTTASILKLLFSLGILVDQQEEYRIFAKSRSISPSPSSSSSFLNTTSNHSDSFLDSKSLSRTSSSSSISSMSSVENNNNNSLNGGSFIGGKTMTSSPSKESVRSRIASALKSTRSARNLISSSSQSSSHSTSPPSPHNNIGIKMKPNRSIAMYGLDNGDELIVKRVVREESFGSSSSSSSSSFALLNISHNQRRIDFSRRNIEFDSFGHMIGNLKRGEKGVCVIDMEKEMKDSEKIIQLILSQNRLKSIPENFFTSFCNIRALDLSNNQLSQFPKGLWTLNRLEKLKMADNELEFIPSEINQLVSLQKISLVRNKINEVTEEIASLPDLRTLLLDDNKIKRLPTKMGSSRLKVLSISNNPMISPPGFICMKGTDAILKYLNGVENALHTQSNSVQVFEFNWKVPFSTGIEDLNKGRGRQRGKIIRNEHRFTARDSVFATQNYIIQFFLESGAKVSSEGSTLLPTLHHRFPLVEAFLSSFKEKKLTMEDTSQLALFSVFEPLGGKRTAEFCRDSLHLKLMEIASNPETHKDNTKLDPRSEEFMNTPEFSNVRHTSAENVDFPNIIKQSFVHLDADFMQIANFEQLSSGAGACSVLIVDNQLVLASVGGCGAMLIRGQTPYRLTEPPIHPKEETSHAPWNTGFGFREQKERGTVDSCPKIKCEVITPRDQFLVLGSSGLFDSLSDRRICETVNRSNSPSEAAEKLVSTAVSRGSNRGISVLVLKICWFVQNTRRNQSVPQPVKQMPPPSRFASAPHLRPITDDEEQRAMEEFIEMSVDTIVPQPKSTSNYFSPSIQQNNYESFHPETATPARRTLLGSARVNPPTTNK